MKCKQYNIIATFIFMLSFLCLFPQKVSAQQTKSNNTQASVQSQASIRLNKAGSVVERGQKVKLKARISNSRSKKVVWKSSKRRVATVNRNGQVIARGKGTAVITAKIAGTNVYAQSVVTVKNYITMRVRTTGYCNCRSCAGKWAGCATASGTRPKENVLLLWTSVLFILEQRLRLVILFILPKILEVPSKVNELMFIMQVTEKLQHMV